MGKRAATAWVRVELYEDPEVGGYTVEVKSWRRGSTADLGAFLELGPFGPSLAELSALADYVQNLLRWLVHDVPGLDAGRML